MGAEKAPHTSPIPKVGMGESPHRAVSSPLIGVFYGCILYKYTTPRDRENNRVLRLLLEKIEG
ncbi:hypothetical protein, partial [Enterobacter hormaechei]